MKLFSSLAIVLMLSSYNFLHAQQTITTKNYEFLIGDWVGEGSGDPGKGVGYFSLQPDLGGKILIRKNHSEYPATAQRPAATHDDLMIIYGDVPGDLSKALYSDNEGHTIHYNIAATADQKGLVLTSIVVANMPTFRLTYTPIDKDNVNLKFEIAPPGKPDAFNTYLEGKVHRK